MLDTQRIQAFLAVAQHGSIARAASALETTQSTISRQISDLEHQCGGLLFHRTGRGMVVSELGHQLLPRFVSLKRDMEGLLQEARGEAGQVSGKVRIGLLPIVASAIGSRLYLELRSRYPKLTLSLLEGYSGQLGQWLDRDVVDFAVLFHYGRGRPDNQDVLAKVDAFVIGGYGDALTAAQNVPFNALDGLPLVLPSSPNPLRLVLEKAFRRMSMDFNLVVEVNSISVQMDLIADCGCYTVSPYFAVARRVADGQLQASPLIDPYIDRHLTLALSTRRPASRAVREVARIVRQILQETQERGIWHRKP